MKIANIIGARPQFIKYFSVAKAIESYNASSSRKMIDVLIHTGQHYDYRMSKIFFDELGIRTPNYHLEVGSGNHGEQTGEAIKRIEQVLLEEAPELVIVYGDTNSTLAGAIAAVKLHIPVAHIESGLRSYNRRMPEEINRILTDHASSLLFCPTRTAIENLRSEGITNGINDGVLIDCKTLHKVGFLPEGSALNVGDVMYDLLLLTAEAAERRSDITGQLGLSSKEYQVLTLHRAENTNDPWRFSEIVRFVNDVTSGKAVIFPMHPRTKQVYDAAAVRFHKAVRIIDPVGYFESFALMKHSSLIMTDSGGMQKEAFWLKIPCITLREETEWAETLQSGWNVLYRNYEGHHAPIDFDDTIYGDGHAAKKIIFATASFLSGQNVQSIHATKCR